MNRNLDVGFSPDGHRLASVSFLDGTVSSGTPSGTGVDRAERTPPPATPTWGLAFSPDGRVLVATQAPGSLQAWRLGHVAVHVHHRGAGPAGVGSRSVPGRRCLRRSDRKGSIVLRNPTPVRRSVPWTRPGQARRRHQPGWPVPGHGYQSWPTIRVWGSRQDDSSRSSMVIPNRLLPGLQPGRREAGVGQLRHDREDLGLRRSEGAASLSGSLRLIAASRSIRTGNASPPRVSMLPSGEIHLWDPGTGRDSQVREATRQLRASPIVPPRWPTPGLPRR